MLCIPTLFAPHTSVKKLITDKQRVRLICSHDLHRMEIILSCRLQRIINIMCLDLLIKHLYAFFLIVGQQTAFKSQSLSVFETVSLHVHLPVHREELMYYQYQKITPAILAHIVFSKGHLISRPQIFIWKKFLQTLFHLTP